jgi:FixJ family two-component response regulator
LASEPSVPGNPTIFIVDDDEEVGGGLTLLLRAHGYVARYFANAEAFLAQAGGIAWRCGLIDVHMPGIGGLKLVERLRASNVAGPQLNLMTGRTSAEIERQAMAAGLPAILAKPLKTSEVLNVVRVAHVTKA